jgi:hypothetical protein
MNGTYDPALRAAMDDIEKVLKKYDIGGFVSLASRTHGEFKMFIETPSWSNARFMKEGKAIHVRLHSKSDHANTEDTVAMLDNIQKMSALAFQQADGIVKMIEKHVKVERTPMNITNEDRP